MLSVLEAPRHVLEGLVLDEGYTPQQINRMSTRYLRFIVWNECAQDRSPEDYGDWDCVDDYEAAR